MSILHKNRKNIRIVLFVIMLMSMLSGFAFATSATPSTTSQTGGKTAKAKTKTKEQMEKDAGEIEGLLKKGKDITSADEARAKELGATQSQIDNAKEGKVADKKELISSQEAANAGAESANAFVEAVNNVEKELSKSVKKTVTSILETVSVLMVGIAMLQVTLTIMPLVSQRGISQIPQGLLGNALKFAFVGWLLQGDNWWNFISAIKNFFMEAGMKFGTKFQNSSTVTTGDIATYIMIAPFKVMGFVADEQINIVWKIMFLLTGLLLLIVCIKVLCDFLVAIIEYDLLGGLSGIYIIFLLWDKTQSFGMKAFNNILASGLKIMLIIAMIGITVQVTEEQAGLLSDGQKPASIFIYCGIIAIMSYMCSIAPDQARSLVAGGGGAASGSGFITSMAKQSVTAITAGATMAMGGFALGKTIAGLVSESKNPLDFMKKAGGKALSKTGQAIKDKVAPVGGAVDAGKALFGTQGGNIIDRLRNAKNAYQNNKGVLGAKQRKAISRAKKEKKKAFIGGLTSVAENAIMFAGGQKSYADAKRSISRTLADNDRYTARSQQEIKNTSDRLKELGVDVTGNMSKDEFEALAQARGEEITYSADDVNGADLDNNGQNIHNGGAMFADNAEMFLGNKGNTVNKDGSVNTNETMRKVEGQTNKYGSKFFASKDGKTVARVLEAGEDKSKFSPKNLMQIRNEKGQTVTMVKVDGAKLNANGRVSVPNSSVKEFIVPKVDNSFNDRRNLDAVTNMTEMKNVSIENIEMAMYEMNQAQEVLKNDETNPQAIIQFENAKTILQAERANFTGTQEQFQNVVKNINTVQIAQKANFSTIASNSQVPFTAEDNKEVLRYTEISRQLNQVGNHIPPAERDQLKEEMGKIETKMENKHGVNLKSRKVRKQIAKAENKAGNIKKNMKEIKKV